MCMCDTLPPSPAASASCWIERAALHKQCRIFESRIRVAIAEQWLQWRFVGQIPRVLLDGACCPAVVAQPALARNN